MHPALNVLGGNLEARNKIVWAPFIPGISACWLYRPEHSASGEGAAALLKARTALRPPGLPRRAHCCGFSSRQALRCPRIGIAGGST